MADPGGFPGYNGSIAKIQTVYVRNLLDDHHFLRTVDFVRQVEALPLPGSPANAGKAEGAAFRTFRVPFV